MQAVIALLLLLSAAAGTGTSLLMSPYSVESPKHLFLSHMVRHEGPTETGSTYELAGMDASAVQRVLQGLPGVQYTRGNASSWRVCACSLRVQGCISAEHVGAEQG